MDYLYSLAPESEGLVLAANVRPWDGLGIVRILGATNEQMNRCTI